MLPVVSAHARSRSPLRAMLLLAVLGLPTFAGLGSGQVPDGNLLLVSFDRQPAVFHESERVDLAVSPATMSTSTVQRVRVFCESGCPTGHVYTYEASKQQVLHFPDEFCEVVNNIRDCDSRPTPRSRLEPRWNGTWVVTLNDAAGLEMFRTRFRVEMTNTWREQYLLEPTNITQAVAGGFVPGTLVRMSFGRLDSVGRDVLFRNLTLRASNFGQVSGAWQIPKTEAQNLGCTPCRKYFVQVTAEAATGNTKTFERVYYFVQPATLHNVILQGPQALQEYERTETVQMRTQTLYPDFSFANGADFDATTPLIRVQRINPENDVITTVYEKRPDYRTAGIWTFNWTIPRDLALTTPGGREFTWRLFMVAGFDKYGNILPENETLTFQIRPAALDAHFVVAPEQLERAEPGTWVVETKYHDGQLLDDKVNGTWFAGSLVRLTDQGEVPVGDSTVRAKYVGQGRWSFTYKFHPGYAFPGPHAFKFHGGVAAANDTWGNEIATNNSAFLLVPAVPRVTLTEKVGHELRNETTGWIRGDNLRIVMRSVYGDGSAYNATTHGYFKFNGTLVKRRGESEVVETVLAQFSISDERLGIWTLDLPLSLTDANTPLGNWTLHLPFRDQESPPNTGEVVVTRRVRAAQILVDPDYLDRSHLNLGESVTWRFTLFYPDGRPATNQDVTSLVVDAWRWSGEKLLGVEVANLAVDWRPNDKWQVTWKPPMGTRLGEFVLVPRGSDKFGNPLEQDRSDAFRVSVPTITREVLTQPAAIIGRNETVFVVFDGLPGDAGEDETGCPRIAVERWAKDRWVIEVEDLVAGRCDPTKDHFASWTTSSSTTLGTYRFSFSGRDAKRAYINATTASFQLRPLAATRPVLAQPADFIAKGETATFVVKHDSTDSFQEGWILLHGERLVRAENKGSNSTEWRLSWRPEFRLESGNYSFEVVGRDKHGNQLAVVSRPFSVRDVVLDCEILEDAPSSIRRLLEASFTFRCYLPDRGLVGALYGAPTVIFEGPDGIVAELEPKPASPNWVLQYKIPVDLATGTYRFRITGDDVAGNPFRSVTTTDMNVIAGAVERSFETAPKSITRLAQATASALGNRTDSQPMTCFAVYVGSSANPQEAKTAPGISTLEIEWAPNPGKGVYDLVWNAPIDAFLGWYRFECEGHDIHGNALKWRSTGFQVAPARLSSALVPGAAPPEEDFRANTLLTWKVRITYPGRSLAYTPELARNGVPNAVFTLDGQAVEQEPEVTWDEKALAWVITWTTPEVLPPGTYVLIVSGSDVHANQVVSLRVADYKVEPEIGERFFGIPGFDRAVPSFGPILGALAALGVALVVLRRRT